MPEWWKVESGNRATPLAAEGGARSDRSGRDRFRDTAAIPAPMPGREIPLQAREDRRDVSIRSELGMTMACFVADSAASQPSRNFLPEILPDGPR